MIIAFIVCIYRYLIPAFDSRIATAVDEKIASRLEQSNSGDIPQTNATARTKPTASDGTVQAGQHSRHSPNLRLASALAHQKLKDQHEKLSTEVSLHHSQLEKQIKALAASIQNLTQQGVSRDARDVTANSRHSERFKVLESQVADQQTKVHKDKARIDGLYSTIREIEGNIAAVTRGQTTASHSPDLATKVSKLESFNTQLDKRVAEIGQAQSFCGKRLDDLELRSRLNASIVDDLKQKVGPGFNDMDAKLAESSSRFTKALEQQRDSLQISITNQRAYINAQISMLQKQLEEAAKYAGGRMQSGNAIPNSDRRQTATDDSKDVSSKAVALALETYKQRLKEIIAASKKKFDEHAVRILGLEQAIFKPSQNALPTEERLDNLEYDVQKLKDDEKGETSGGRAVFEQVDALQTQIEKLRTDVRTAFTRAVTQEAHRRMLEEQGSFKQQMMVQLGAVEQEQANLSRRTQSFEIRLKAILRDCDSCWVKIRELSEPELSRLAELEVVLKKANESFSVGLVEIKQQVELLEAGFATLGDGLLARIADYQAASVMGEIESSRSSVSNTDRFTSTVHSHINSEDLPSSCPSARRKPSNWSGIGSIEASGSDLRVQPTSFRNTAALRHALQGNNNADVKGSEPAETHGGKRHELSGNPPLSLQAHASTSPFGPRRNLISASPERQTTSLADRVKALEQKMLTLLKSSRPSSLDLTQATNSTSLLPFEHFEISPLNLSRSPAQLSIKLSSPMYSYTHPSEIEDVPKSDLTDQHVKPTRTTSMTSPGIWQLSSVQQGYLQQLTTEVQRLKTDVNKRLSSVGKVMATIGVPAQPKSSSNGTSPSQSGRSAILAQGTSTSIPQVSEDAKLPVEQAVTGWQATLAELRAKVEQVQTDLRRFEASIKRESAALSAFKGEIQNRWARQLGSLPPASMVHELAAKYQALANRINTLEYHLRQRRVI